jgi:RNA polymerase sigma factor for flagellar operon FliA
VKLAQTYNPARGTPFAQFASARLRGALVDELRGLDWVSRTTRSRARKVNTCRQELSAGLGRTPTSLEVAESLGITVRDVEGAARDEHQAVVLSLHNLTPDAVANLVREQGPGPEDLVLRREQVGYLRDAIEALPHRLRTVVVQCFIDERPMAEIAAELEVTQSRVSQMRTEALIMLRDGINAQLDPDLVAAPGPPARRPIPPRRAAYYAEIAASGDLHSRLSDVNFEKHLSGSIRPMAQRAR